MGREERGLFITAAREERRGDLLLRGKEMEERGEGKGISPSPVRVARINTLWCLSVSFCLSSLL